MEENMFRKFLTTTILTLLLAMVTLAQTGKVSGTIVDKETNQPLIGANVLVVGTSLGAATDINGNYNISNLNTGVYTLKASYLGYQDVILENITVNSGLTSEADFKLPSKSVETQTVVIVSQRPLIQKSATNAVRIVTAEDLQSLPVRSINSIIGLQAGVVQQNGATYIRGSRADETGYMVEGASTKNMISSNGGNLVGLIPDAVSEIQVQAGGFSAEYGNANAGIVTQEFRTGTDKYHLSFRAETDNFGNYPGDKFLGTYSYGESDYVATISGPVISDKVKIFLAGENRFRRDASPMFFSGNPYAYSDGALFDTTRIYDNGVSGGSTKDSQILTWPAGNILGQMTNSYLLNGTLSFDFKPLLIRVSGSYTNSLSRNNVNDVRYYFDLSRLGYTKSTDAFVNVKGTYLLANSSYIEANINYDDNRSKTYDNTYKDNYLAYSDSLLAAHNGWTNFVNYTSGPYLYNFNGFPFYRPGTLLTGFGMRKWTSLGGSVAYTAQIGNHEFKAGGSLQRWAIRSYGVGGSSTLLNNARNNPEYARDPAAWSYFLQTQNYRQLNGIYGYDFFGNEVNSGPYTDHTPLIGGAYIQDKLEINDLTINAGLRFDYIDMDAWKLSDPTNPTYDLNTKLVPESEILPGRKFKYVSPHIGFSFPVTDRTVFHFQYGKYVQAPALTSAYGGTLYQTQVLIGGNAFTTAFAYDPEPIRTTQYEVGFTQQFTDFAAFDITAYYKDIRGQLQYAWQNVVSGSQVARYPVLINQDFASTKGVELSLRIRRVNRVRAEINYTYSNAQGTNSFQGSAFGSVQTNAQSPTVIQPLAYDQTHRGSFIVDYRFGKDDGGPILQQLGINLLFTFNSGHPYTPAAQQGLGQNSPWQGALTTDTRSRRPTGPINSATTPWNYELNLRIDKTVAFFDKLDVNFYVRVTNLLNTQNVINVYDQTGNAYDDGFLGTASGENLVANPVYGTRFADLYRALDLTNREHSISQLGTDLFGVPRQIIAGLVLNF
jgi:outer membrane receptor protein involved in Fe transport